MAPFNYTGFSLHLLTSLVATPKFPSLFGPLQIGAPSSFPTLTVPNFPTAPINITLLNPVCEIIPPLDDHATCTPFVPVKNNLGRYMQSRNFVSPETSLLTFEYYSHHPRLPVPVRPKPVKVPKSPPPKLSQWTITKVYYDMHRRRFQRSVSQLLDSGKKRGDSMMMTIKSKTSPALIICNSSIEYIDSIPDLYPRGFGFFTFVLGLVLSSAVKSFARSTVSSVSTTFKNYYTLAVILSPLVPAFLSLCLVYVKSFFRQVVAFAGDVFDAAHEYSDMVSKGEDPLDEQIGSFICQIASTAVDVFDAAHVYLGVDLDVYLDSDLEESVAVEGSQGASAEMILLPVQPPSSPPVTSTSGQLVAPTSDQPTTPVVASSSSSSPLVNNGDMISVETSLASSSSIRVESSDGDSGSSGTLGASQETLTPADVPLPPSPLLPSTPSPPPTPSCNTAPEAQDTIDKKLDWADDSRTLSPAPSFPAPSPPSPTLPSTANTSTSTAVDADVSNNNDDNGFTVVKKRKPKKKAAEHKRPVSKNIWEEANANTSVTMIGMEYNKGGKKNKKGKGNGKGKGVSPINNTCPLPSSSSSSSTPPSNPLPPRPRTSSISSIDDSPLASNPAFFRRIVNYPLPPKPTGKLVIPPAPPKPGERKANPSTKDFDYVLDQLEKIYWENDDLGEKYWDHARRNPSEEPSKPSK